MSSMEYWLWLAELPGLGNPLKLELLRYFGGHPAAVYSGDPEAYRLVEGMTPRGVQALEDKSLEQADRILGDCERLGLSIITIRDTSYPDRLRNIYDPPLVLYVQGRLPRFDDEVAVAMVGTRRVSAYGLEIGERLAFALAGMGALIVSGLAEGGDAAAHRGALRAGGLTVGVIGGGHDIIYPRSSRYLYEDLAVRGAILSEYPPGTEHRAGHFPVRNRIISGLSVATVVVEAPEGSGALLTAARAQEQGRELFVVPGQVGDPHCAGSNKLLRDSARVVLDAWDILQYYAGMYPHKIRGLRITEPRGFGGGAVEQKEKPKKQEKPEKSPKEPERPVLDLSGEHGLTDDQLVVVRVLQKGTMQVDEIIEASQLPARRVLSALTILEIDGIAAQESGKRFTLTVTVK